MESSRAQQVLELIKSQAVVRSRDIAQAGIQRNYLSVLCKRGLIERVGRGLYRAVDSEFTQHQSLAEIAKRVPNSVVCLLSALSFHGLTTQNPSQIWIALGEKARYPELDAWSVRVFRFSGTALEYGIEKHEIDGVPVRVYSPAKTVADCFKYRNKIGLDVALEALRDCWQQRKATMNELLEAAQACRVGKVMRPYLESLA